MRNQNTLLVIGLILLALALFAASIGSFFLYGLAMYFIGAIIGFILAHAILTQEEDDDSN